MKPVRMSKIEVLGPNSYKEQVIEKLHELGALHVVDHSKDDTFDIGSPLDVSEELSSLLVTIRGMKSLLSVTGEGKAEDVDASKIEKKIEKLSTETESLFAEKKQLESEISKLSSQHTIVEPLSHIPVSFGQLQTSSYLGFTVGSFDAIVNPLEVHQKLRNASQHVELRHHDHEGKTWAVVVTTKEKLDDVRGVLSELTFSEVDLDAYVENNALVLPSAVLKAKEAAAKKHETVTSKIESIISKEKKFLLDTEASLTVALDKAQLPLRFGSTQETFLVKGWIPTCEEKKFEQEIAMAADSKIVIKMQKADPHHDKNIPVKIQNSKVWKPFEYLLKLYSLPKYAEVDPTIFMFITFPLFFGLMLGDVIYGLVVVIACLTLMIKVPSMKDLAKVVLWAGIVSMAFGGLYGEYLGFEYVSIETGEKLCSVGICFLHIEELHHGSHDKEHAEDDGHGDTSGHGEDTHSKTADEAHALGSDTPSAKSRTASFDGLDILNVGLPLAQPASEEPIVLNTIREDAEAVHEETTALEEEEEVVVDSHAEDTHSEVHDTHATVDNHAKDAHIDEAHHEPELAYTFPRIFSRPHHKTTVFGLELFTVLVIGLVAGFIHINFSLFVGFMNAWTAHGFMEAFYEKISWYILQIGVFMLPFGYGPAWLAYVIIGIAIVLIWKGEGVQGLVELPAIFSNMASYMRIGAVGLASVGLAIVVNDNLALPLIKMGGWWLALGILVMILGHTINILLGIIGPFLHSIRLHYVEFFARFYKGGGEPYNPFGGKSE